MPFHIITLKKTKMSRCQDVKMARGSHGDTWGVRSRVFDLFPNDKNRETEVSRGFRFFFCLVLSVL